MRQIVKAAIPVAFFTPALLAAAVQLVDEQPTLKAVAFRFVNHKILGFLGGAVAFGWVFGPVLVVLGVVIFLAMIFRKKLAMNAIAAVIVFLGLASIACVQGCANLSRIGK